MLRQINRQLFQLADRNRWRLRRGCDSDRDSYIRLLVFLWLGDSCWKRDIFVDRCMSMRASTCNSIGDCCGNWQGRAKTEIMIRDGKLAFSILQRAETIWFDKTGTLTEGRPRVVTMTGSVEGLRHAAGIEVHCCHPIADGNRQTRRKRLSLTLPA